MRTIYHNGLVFTGQLPLCQAFVVEGDRFTYVGNDEAAFAQPADRIVDLQGQFVCAGFNDSHMHLLSFGQTLQTAPLNRHTTSLNDLIGCLHNHAAMIPDGWVMGRGWNQDFFCDIQRMPNR